MTTNSQKSTLGWSWSLPKHLPRHETPPEIREESLGDLFVYSKRPEVAMMKFNSDIVVYSGLLNGNHRLADVR